MGDARVHPLNLALPPAVQRTVQRGIELSQGADPRGTDAAWAAKALAGELAPADVRETADWFAQAAATPTFAAARRKRGGPEYLGWLLRGGAAGERWAVDVAAALDVLDAAGVPGGARNVPEPAVEVPARTGVAVVVPLRPEEAELLAQPSGLPAEELHATLLYLGKTGDILPPVLDAIMESLSALAASTSPFAARVTGIARFEGVDDGESDAIVALLSSPVLDDLRAAVVSLAAEHGRASASEHGFHAHVTLGYVAPGAELGVSRAPLATVTVDALAMWVGSTRVSFALQGLPAEGGAPPLAPTETTMSDPTTTATAPLPPSTPEVTPPVSLRGKVVQFDTGEGDPIENEDWNRAHVVGRLRAWASVDGTGDYRALDAEKLSRAFAWYDPQSAAAANINAYRLPHHDVIGGKLVLTRQGLLAACRALMGGEHGIPEEDEGEVRLHLARHCAQFSMAPPWEAQRTGTTELDATTMAAPSAEAVEGGVVSESWIQLARTGVFKGHSAGPFEFNTGVYARIIANFLATANRRVPVDYEHATEILNDSTLQKGAPAVGWIVELDNRGEAGLYGRVQWVDAEAVGYIRTGRYRYFSPAVAFNAIHPVTGEPQGPTLVSGGLTNRPFLDGMAPVTARAEAVPMTAPAASAPVLGEVTPEEHAVIQARIDALPAPAREVIAASATVLTEAPVVTAEAPSDTPVDVPAAPITLRDALTTAWTSASAAGLRTLSWNGYVDDIDDLGDLLSFVGYVLGLPKIATETDILAGLDKLAQYTVGDMGARDAVDVERVIRHLRVELNLPVLTPAPDVVGAVVRRVIDLRPAPASPAVEPAAMTVGTADVHVPTGGEVQPSATPMSAKEPPEMNPEILAALELPAGSDDTAVLAAVKALSARVDGFARATATATVDALVTRGAVAASGREHAIVTAMRDPDGFAAMFPPPPPAPAAGTKPPAREVPTALSTVVSQPAPGTPPAPGAQPLPALPPMPRTPEYSTRLHAEATARMSTAAAAGQPITLRSAMEAVEAQWATIRAGR